MELREPSRSHGECGLPVSWAISGPGLSLCSRPWRRGAAVVSLVRLRAAGCRASESHTLRIFGSPLSGLCVLTQPFCGQLEPLGRRPRRSDISGNVGLYLPSPLHILTGLSVLCAIRLLGSCRHSCSRFLKHLRFSCSIVVRPDSVEGAMKSSSRR